MEAQRSNTAVDAENIVETARSLDGKEGYKCIVDNPGTLLEAGTVGDVASSRSMNAGAGAT
jgi:hypothetical protein